MNKTLGFKQIFSRIFSRKTGYKPDDFSKNTFAELPEKSTEQSSGIFRGSSAVPGRWRAEHGGRYYAVNNCGVTSLFKDDYYGFDDDCYRSGNYFRTLDEAETYAEKWRNLFN